VTCYDLRPMLLTIPSDLQTDYDYSIDDSYYYGNFSDCPLPLPTSQYEALKDFYYSTSGPTWCLPSGNRISLLQGSACLINFMT
jgi:hypothetical protein